MVRKGSSARWCSSLKLAEFNLMTEFVGEPPIMLLDDVMSDLDDTRRRHLLEWTRRRCQTFVTCTNLRMFSDEVLAESAVLHVQAGTLERVEGRSAEEGDRYPDPPPLPPILGETIAQCDSAEAT